MDPRRFTTVKSIESLRLITYGVQLDFFFLLHLNWITIN